MAQALPAIFSALQVGSIAAVKFMGFTGWGAMAAMTAATIVMGEVAKALMGKPDLESMRGINFNTRDPSATRKILYGTCRTGGVIVFADTTGVDNKYLHIIIAVAGHKVNAFKKVLFDDVVVWDNGTYQTFDVVNETRDWEDYVDFEFRDGTQTVAIPQLVLDVNDWTSNHKLLDTAYVYCRLKYNNSAYTSGIPNISFIIEGKKIYDPRKDSTSSVYDASLGVSTHRADTESTWSFSNNSALCLLDYMRDSEHGLNEDIANINLAELAASADVCDQDVSLSAGGTQKRYTCDGQLDTRASFKSNMENILSSMIGTCAYSAGQFHITAHYYKTPDANVIDETMMVGGLQVVTKTSRRKLYNAVKGQFISEEENYVVADYPAQTSSTYATADGETIYLDLTHTMVTNNIRAQRLARLSMLKSRLQMAVSFKTNLKGMRYKIGDNIKITNAKMGFVEKVFMVTGYELTPDPTLGMVVDIKAIENSSAAYDWTTSDEEDFTNSGTISLYDGRAIAAPTNLVMNASSSTEDDGTVENAVRISFTGTDDVFLDHYLVKIRETAESDFNVYYTDSSPFKVAGLKPFTGYTVEVRSVNQLGNQSTALTGTFTSAVDYIPRAPSIYRISKSGAAAPTLAEFTAAAGRNPKDKDAVITTDTSVTPVATHAWTYDLSGTAWTQDDNFITGDLIVAGTITGNEIKADTITANKLSGDVSELFPISAYQSTTLTTSYQDFQEFSVPAPELGISKRVRLDLRTNYVLTKTGSNQRDFTINQKIQVKSKSATGTQVGATGGVVVVGTPFLYKQEIYISGNHLASLDTVGGVADNSSGTGYGTVEGLWYDSANDRTHMLVGQTVVVFSTGDTLYFSPYKFAAVGTFVAPSYTDNHRIVMLSDINSDDVSIEVPYTFGETTTATVFRIAARITTVYSDVTVTGRGYRGTMELVS